MRRLTVDEYKELTLSILFAIDDICTQEGIIYYLHAGTLLGAVRHSGFIPWDDDIDICLKRADYDRLASVIDNGDYPLRFIRIETHEDAICPFGKICDTSTVMHEKNFRHPEGYGAFVDVFPFDYLPDNDKQREMLRKKYRFKQRLIENSARTGYEHGRDATETLKRRIGFLMGRLVDTEHAVRSLNNELKKLNENETGHLGIGWSYSYPSECYGDPVLLEFEGRMLPAPSSPNTVLNILFGNYMTLPPLEERVSRHQLECYLIEGGDK